MKVPLLDLKAQYQSIRPEIEAALGPVIESQAFVLGIPVSECEKALAGYSGTRGGCGVSSGTDALLIALMNEGIGPGDEVITTPYTFFATAGAIARVGARPVFADIDPVTFNINPSEIQTRITKHTRAIIPVHLYGQLADMPAILRIAEENNLVVIEDAAQAIGAGHGGLQAGAGGHYGCFSFFPSKNLGCFGDGGMVVSQDDKRIERLKILRDHGQHPRYYYGMIGGNFRLDALQAAVINVKIRHLDSWTEARIKNAARYEELFRSASLDKKIGIPAVTTDRHVFNQYIIRCKERDGLMDYLQKSGVGCAIYYPLALHRQGCFRDLGYKERDFPESERASRETLALPVYPELSAEQQEYVVQTILKFTRQ